MECPACQTAEHRRREVLREVRRAAARDNQRSGSAHRRPSSAAASASPASSARAAWAASTGRAAARDASPQGRGQDAAHPHLSRDPQILARFEREVRDDRRARAPEHDPGLRLRQDRHGRALHRDGVPHRQDPRRRRSRRAAPWRPSASTTSWTRSAARSKRRTGRGIVHRDLKPDNIVLAERAGEEGLREGARLRDRQALEEEDKNEQKLTQQGMVLGTPPYMSPEQFTGAHRRAQRHLLARRHGVRDAHRRASRSRPTRRGSGRRST